MKNIKEVLFALLLTAMFLNPVQAATEKDADSLAIRVQDTQSAQIDNDDNEKPKKKKTAKKSKKTKKAKKISG